MLDLTGLGIEPQTLNTDSDALNNRANQPVSLKQRFSEIACSITVMNKITILYLLLVVLFYFLAVILCVNSWLLLPLPKRSVMNSFLLSICADNAFP